MKYNYEATIVLADGQQRSVTGCVENTRRGNILQTIDRALQETFASTGIENMPGKKFVSRLLLEELVK
ncbi:MAG TPA: hypothetical protein VH593_10815 [Ktedonobacteraceae bacterium]|jgi:hypothetical protein